MATEIVQRLYNALDTSTELLQKELDISYLEAFLETAENIIDNRQARVIDGKPSEKAVSELNEIYATIELEVATPEHIREAIQLVVLKAMREEHVQVNHQMTPDVMGLIIYYFIRLFLDEDVKELQLLELGVGTGNLLNTVYNKLDEGKELQITGDGVEIDDLLLSIAASSSLLQGNHNIRYTLQDALRNLYVQPADIVLSDLPVGYYPDDVHAQTFETAFEEGHSFSHYLLIEQALKYTKDNGFGFFIVPSLLFQDERASVLLNYILEVGYFQGLIQLPKTFFSDEKAQQSILIIQKKGDTAKQAKEVLIASTPDFSQSQHVEQFLAEINQWKHNNF